MAQPDAPQRTDAAAPFNQPSADLILRTADLVDFRVHSQILAQASPFFASMLALPQPPASAKSSDGDAGNPVVPVSEDSTTLELLLRLVYPIPKLHTQLDDPEKMVPALRAATKYDMELPTEILSGWLTAIIPKSPLQVWAAACRTGLEVVARRAAEALKKTWTRPDKLETLALMNELGDMSGISAGDYFRLKRYLMSENGSATESLKLLSPGQPPTPRLLRGASQFSTEIPDIDVECSSSRGGRTKLFGAHKSVLASHSSVWKARLANLRMQHMSTDSESSGPILPQLDFDEDSDTLAALLRVCYTGELGLPADIESLGQLLLAARKYDMPHVTTCARLAWDDAASRNPLEAYFVAINHGLRDYAEAVARKVLAKQTAHVYTSVMERSSALAYHRMLVYYDASCTMIRDRALQAIAKLPENIDYYNAYRPTYDARAVKTGWKGAIEGKTFGSPEDIKHVLKKMVQPKYDTPKIEGYVGAVLHCVLTVQDETEQELNKIHINLG
ncbi:hypothetical protein C2E23DRAFT_885373 [Lenzites betulinus]|nr:hypothetical protein C2E23DRAFT_885373 [Lenzites betulinus]